MEKIRYHHISFRNAFEGIKWAFTSQPNFRIHSFLSILILISGLVFHISLVEFSILILTIALGMGTEMVNTSLEAMTDLITLEYKKDAKVAKDVAAGMMLIVAIGAVLVAGFIFLPRLLIFLRLPTD